MTLLTKWIRQPWHNLFDWNVEILGEKVQLGVCKETGHFDTKLFWYIHKQWNCTQILFTLSLFCTWTRKTFWVNIICSLSHVEQFTPWLNKLVSKWLCIKITSNRLQYYFMWHLEISITLFFRPGYLLVKAASIIFCCIEHL